MPRLILPRGFLNSAYEPQLTAAQRYQIYFGGAGSGKSTFLATRCVLDTLQGRNTLIVRQVARTLKTSCWNEVNKAIGRMGLTRMFRVNRTDFTVTAKNGAQILFAGLDDVEKIKSVTPAHGALTDIWMEEATECAYADYKQLDKRLRGASPHPKRFTLSFNPVSKSHWLYKEFFSVWTQPDAPQNADPAARRLPPPARKCVSGSVLILKTTYRDNRFLTPDDRAALENERDPYFYQVYTLGNWGEMGQTIFHNWRVSPVPADVPGETRMGLDFGFASDPCGFVRLRYDRKLRRVYILEEFAEKGLTNFDLAARLRTLAGGGAIACDSAEPKSIAELRRLNVHAYPVRKGPDSVLHGVQWLRQMEIIVSPACPHVQRELESYQWQTDREGNALPQPRDRDNHLIDAIRYALAEDMTERFACTARGL